MKITQPAASRDCPDGIGRPVPGCSDRPGTHRAGKPAAPASSAVDSAEEKRRDSKLPLVVLGLGAGLALAAAGGCEDGTASPVAPQFLEFIPLTPDDVSVATQPFGGVLHPPFPRTSEHPFTMSQAGPVVVELTSFSVSGDAPAVSTLIELAEGDCAGAAGCSVVALRELGQLPIPGTTQASLSAGTNTVRVTISAAPEEPIGAVAYTGQVTHPR